MSNIVEMLRDEADIIAGDGATEYSVNLLVAAANRIEELESKVDNRAELQEETHWDGEGFPPVGCECECWTGDEWLPGISVGPYLNGWLCMIENNVNKPFIGVIGDFRPPRPKALEYHSQDLTKVAEAKIHEGCTCHRG